MTAKSNTISMEQKMVLVRYMETHPDLSRGKLKAKSCHEDFMRMWKEATQQLNSCRNGPKKNLVYWRQTWNDMKKTTRAKILQRRTGGTDGMIVKLSPLQKRIAGLMCPFRSRCSVTTTNQDSLNSDYLVPQTSLVEGPALSITLNGNCETNNVPEPVMPVIHRVEANSLACVKSESIIIDDNISNGADWNNSPEENEVSESPRSQACDQNQVDNTEVTDLGHGSLNQVNTNEFNASSSSPDFQHHSIGKCLPLNAHCYSGNIQDQQYPQVDSDKFFEYQKQSAEALSQMAESHRKMAEAALRTATAEERKATALEHLVALLT